MYQPWILDSPATRSIVVPVVSIGGEPLALIVKYSDVEGFYRAGDKYYVHLHSTVKGIRQLSVLVDAIKVDVKDAKDFSPSGSFEEGSVLRITTPFSVPWYCTSTCNAVVMQIKDGSVLVRVADIYKYYKFITEKFPLCVELFANELVGNEEVASKAAEICSKVFGSILHDCGSLRGHIVAAACTLVAARMSSYPLTIGELVSRFNIPQSDIYEAYKHIVEKLRIGAKDVSINMETYIRNLVSRIVSDPEKAQKVAEEAVKLYELAKQHGITGGRDPKAVAAAAIYIAANDQRIRVTQRELTRLVHVTETTIRKRIKELQLLLGKLQDREITFRGDDREVR